MPAGVIAPGLLALHPRLTTFVATRGQRLLLGAIAQCLRQYVRPQHSWRSTTAATKAGIALLHRSRPFLVRDVRSTFWDHKQVPVPAHCPTVEPKRSMTARTNPKGLSDAPIGRP